MAEESGLKEGTKGPGGPAGARPGRDYVEENLGMLLMRAFYDFRGLLSRQLVKHELEEWMRPGMGPVLFALLRKDDVTIREIAEELPLAPSTLTNTLKAMAKSGLVEMSSCEADKRSVRVRLTELGKSLGPKLTAMHDENREILNAGLKAKEVGELKHHLAKVIDALAVDAWEAKHPGRDEG